MAIGRARGGWTAVEGNLTPRRWALVVVDSGAPLARMVQRDFAQIAALSEGFVAIFGCWRGGVAIIIERYRQRLKNK